MGRFVAKCETAGMRINMSESEAMVLSPAGNDLLPEAEEFKYLRVLFTSKGRREKMGLV